MRLVVDFQGAQSSGSRTRGIGRYTTTIAQAIATSPEKPEVILLLNGAFSDTIEPIRAEFSGILPQENLVVWEPLGPVGYIHAQNEGRRRASELLREAVIARLNPDALLITSHFEGCGDDAVSTIGLLPANYPTAVILYDLIPLIYRSTYLANPSVEKWYENRIGSIKRAELLLAISQSSRGEAIEHLGFPPDRALAIGTAANAQFRPVKLTDCEREELWARHGIKKPFVMYTGGIDHRKNIEGLIEAFSKLPPAVRKRHQLAVVCSIREEDRPRLQQMAQHAGLKEHQLILTGFVPEEDLIALYSSCKLFVFPSWHEGFGLPALEAMTCGAPVIASDRSSLPEVIGEQQALFDPHDSNAIAAKMSAALTDEVFRKRLIKDGLKRAAEFSWDTVAERALSSIVRIASEGRTKPATPLRQRLRLAMVSPVPPAESGIAYYTASLIRALNEHYKIDIVLKDGESTNDPFILANCEIINADTFRTRFKEYERVVYQFGNSDHHNYMVDLITELPGIVVLHDFFVSDLSSWREHLGSVPGNWGHDLHESHGLGALLERHSGADLISVIKKYPCSFAVTRHAIGVICHSEEAKSLQSAWHGAEAARNWAVVPMIRSKRALPNRAEARKALGIESDEFLVCAFGILGKAKLNHVLVEAWNRSKPGSQKRARLVFVGGHGAEDYFSDLQRQASNGIGSSRIEFPGWVSEAEYDRYLAAADLAVQLRGTSHGETSAAALDAMLAGVPVIASASSSVPPEARRVIISLAKGQGVDRLVQLLNKMAADSKWRNRIGTAARDYAMSNHSERACATKFAAAMETAYNGSMATLHNAMCDLAGLHLSAGEAEQLAREFARTLPSSATLLLDVSSLVPDLENAVATILKPLLERLAASRPNLRTIALERTENGYVSATAKILFAAGLPPLYDMPEHVSINSRDWLVALAPDDTEYLERLSRIAGASFLAISPKDLDPAKIAAAILKMTNQKARSTNLARHFIPSFSGPSPHVSS
jgi:glycosyltransferase involved in cell wall biosynthesis